MKRFLKTTLLFLALILCLSCLFSCGKDSGNTENGNNENNTQEEIKPIFLSEITLSETVDNFSFNKETFEYTVEIPDGRPKIPQISANADEGEIEIKQAAIPDSQKEGTAKITVKDGERKAEYFITFKKNADKGFILQYLDEYPLNKGEGNYASSNPDVISVDSAGVLSVKGISEDPITITTPDGATIVVDKVIKAQTALILVTGQSNAQGCFDSDPGNKYFIDGKTQQSMVEQPERKGQAFELDTYTSPENPYGVSGAMTSAIYDLAEIKRMGFSSTLGKTWYEQSGEKALLLNAALSGSPIESWLDPKKSDDAGTYNSNQCYNNLKQRYSILQKLLERDGNFEITRTYNIWLQGETAMKNTYYKKLGNYDLATIKEQNKKFNFDKSPLTAEEYYNYFLLVEQQMKEDFGVTFQGLILPRATTSVASQESINCGLMTDLVPIRAAQYYLGNNNKSIAVVSRLGDISVEQKYTQYSGKEGYGYIGTKNTHYNQSGYNAQGKVVGENLVSAMFYFKDKEQKAKDVELLHSDGRVKFNQNEWLKLKPSQEYRMGAIAIPEYTCETLTYQSSDENIATIDQYGMIKAVSVGNCDITVSSESGASKTIKLQIME